MTARRARSAGRTSYPGPAPFIAWLATHIGDEPTRRRQQLVAQSYLDWSWGDGGSASTRRSRFLAGAGPRLGLTRAQLDEAMDSFTEHQAGVESVEVENR